MPLLGCGWYVLPCCGVKRGRSGLNTCRHSTRYHSRVRPPASIPSSPWNCTASRPRISSGVRMRIWWYESSNTAERRTRMRMDPAALWSKRWVILARRCALLLSKSTRRGFLSSSLRLPSSSAGFCRASALRSFLWASPKRRKGSVLASTVPMLGRGPSRTLTLEPERTSGARVMRGPLPIWVWVMGAPARRSASRCCAGVTS
mmetsp:Transcript_72757/g.229197  ORF Transcript_72757/g.229197 Transcript_72757/m.229197 type:complete len:203 (+) Transcript_72757:1025-1633(+)